MTIVINDMEFFAFHGFYEEEQAVGCRYTVDLTIDLKSSLSGETDILGDTLNYEKVYRVVREEMNKVSKLIENVALRIVDRLKSEYTIIDRVEIQLFKHNPPLGGQVGKVSIKLCK